MKKFLLFILLTISIIVHSQNYIDKIVAKACNCTDSISDTLNLQQSNMKLGACLISASMPFKKELKKEYNIDLDNFNNIEGEKLGKLVGVKMATMCPNKLLKIVNRKEKKEQTERTDKTEEIIKGNIVKIENDPFVVFSVKDETGKISKLFWFTFVESKVDLMTQYNLIMGNTVSITFITQELFDPKINEYRKFNIIIKFEITE